MIRVTGKVKRTKPIFIDSFKFMKSATKHTTKQTIPAPAMLHLRPGRSGISKEAYPELAEFWADVGAAYRAEIQDLGAAGCTYLQLDDTSFAYLCDEKFAGALAQRGDDPKKLAWTYAEAINASCAYITEQGYEMEIAIEPKPNEPRGNLFLPTVGHALAFIHELEYPEMVGLNPEFAHETMSGLSFHHGVAQALWADKLFHIDLNGQVPGKYDQDFRFGSEGHKDAFYLVKLLEEAEWNGMRHFDAHAYRTEDEEGVWEFARGCMRTYLILKEKAARFAEDVDIQEALAVAKVDQLGLPTLPEPPETRWKTLREETFDVDALAGYGYGHERLDQLVTELLLGVR